MRPVYRHVAFVCLGFLAAAGSLFAQKPAAAPSSTPAAPPTTQSISPSMRRVPPGMIYHRVYVVSPLVGSGKPGDARRPVLVPAPPALTNAPAVSSRPAAAAANADITQTGLLGFQMQLSDDGQYALAELVYANPLAFQAALKNEVASRNISVAAVPQGASAAAMSGALATALQSAVPGLQIFESGQVTQAQIQSAFQQKKATFNFASSSVRP
jgi:hypothetical protein